MKNNNRMNIRILIYAGIIFIIFQSCAKAKQPVIPPPPPPPEVVTTISVNVNNVLKNLTGNEVGINMNYLMDGSVISGQSLATVTQSLKNTNAKFLRYPGGEKSDNYLFSTPPYTAANPRAAYCAWPSTESRFFNSDLSCKSEVLDFDEFITLSKSCGAEPLIVVAYDAIYNTNAGCTAPTKAALVTHAKEWVRYANITKGYQVKYWMIGNESFLPTTYNGFTTPAQYAVDLVDFVDAMKSIDPTIKIIVNGKSDWWQTLLQSPAASRIDFLGISNYLGNAFTGYDYYRQNQPSLNSETDAAINAIGNFAPAIDKDRIKVMETEFNSIAFVNNGWANDNNVGHALCSFQMLADGIIKPKLFASFLWNTRWIETLAKPRHLFDALHANGSLNATGLSLSILGKYLLPQMVATTDSGYIKVYATYNTTNKNLNIFIINKDNAAQKVKLTITGYPTAFSFQKYEFRGVDAEDRLPSFNAVGAIETNTGLNNAISLPQNSITMLEIK